MCLTQDRYREWIPLRAVFNVYGENSLVERWWIGHHEWFGIQRERARGGRFIVVSIDEYVDRLVGDQV